MRLDDVKTCDTHIQTRARKHARISTPGGSLARSHHSSHARTHADTTHTHTHARTRRVYRSPVGEESNQKLGGHHIWIILVHFWDKTFWRKWHNHVMDLCSDFTVINVDLAFHSVHVVYINMRIYRKTWRHWYWVNKLIIKLSWMQAVRWLLSPAVCRK